MITCPSTPEWKRSSDLDLNGEAVPDEDDDGGPAAPLHVCIVLRELFVPSFDVLCPSTKMMQ